MAISPLYQQITTLLVQVSHPKTAGATYQQYSSLDLPNVNLFSPSFIILLHYPKVTLNGEL